MSDTWWIPKQKQYLPETKRWYCGNCKKRTPIERNPEWDGEFRGERPAPKWFTRCKYCKSNHWQNTEYECPNCGWDENYDDYWEDENGIMHLPDNMISCGKPYYVPNAEGWNRHDWEETWKCPKCKTIFSYTNSDC